MRVLIVKTSSMGDVIHTLPAVTDALRHKKGLIFDWVVEEGFAEIPAWHSGVGEVIPVAIRRWRKQPFKTLRSTEWKQFKRRLRKHHYDLVIDAQGLLKSAWLTRFVKAPVAGYDKNSVREFYASWFYQHQYLVDKNQHAVERIRELFAAALGYEKPSDQGDYGLDACRFFGSQAESANVVFLHGTTRDDKHYPEIYWQQLANKLVADGYRVRIPWSNERELARAQRIAAGCSQVEVLPRLNLRGIATVLAQASAVIAVDTGLGHLTAALNIPAISLYGPTEPGLVGAYGDNQIHLKASNCQPVDERRDQLVGPAVFSPLTPDLVMSKLQQLLKASNRSAIL